MVEKPSQLDLTEENVAVMAAAVGLPIDRERLADVTAVLAELFVLEAMLNDLDLTGCGPDLDGTSWPGAQR